MAITQKSLIDSVPTKLLIGGGWREASSGERFDVHDPSSGATLTTVRRRHARGRPGRAGRRGRGAGRLGRDRRRGSAARSCAAPSS